MTKAKQKSPNDIPPGFVEACWAILVTLDVKVTAEEFVRWLANRKDTSPSSEFLPELSELRDLAQHQGRPDISRAFAGMIARTNESEGGEHG